MLVLATSVLVTDGNKKVVKVPYIYYLVRFQEEQIKTLLNIDSKINAISSSYIKKLDLKVWQINVRAQKIDDFTLEIFGMIIADF